MAAMTSRERVTLALNHKEPDRVPIDLGSIASTIRTVDAYDRLKNCLGLALDKKIRHFADEHIIPDEEILQGVTRRHILFADECPEKLEENSSG